MEKRLRSSLQSSAESFLSSATKLSLKSAKSSLKTLIHSINPTSELSNSLPLSLLASISHSVDSFKEPIHGTRNASSPPSPPTKRHRRSSRSDKPQNEPSREETPQTEQTSVLQKLQIYAYVALLCTTHPSRAFSPEDLLPCVRLLHDNLVLFESDSVLLSEVSSLCEEWWKEELEGRELLISQFIPLLLSRSLTLKKKVDLHRVYVLREALLQFDFEDESIEDLKLLLVRCVISPLYVKNEDGRKFLAFTFGLSLQLLKEILAMIKSQIPFGKKSMLEAYGEVVFRGWKSVDADLKMEIEEGFLQGLIDGAIHASSAPFAAGIRRVLGGFVNQRTTEGVEKLLFRQAEPVIFRSLQVANSNVRQNALHLLLDLFPLEDPDATKEVKDTFLEKQFFLLERLFVDDCPDIRVVAVEGCCRILHLFWELIPSSIITKFLTRAFDDMSHDISSDVRLSTLNGIIYLLGNPHSHEIMKVLLPRLGHMILDSVLSVRAATIDLLLLLRDTQGFQFNKVVDLDMLLNALADDEPLIAQKITQLLIPSYLPSKVGIPEACNRCLTLVKRSPKAGARFCEFASSEGASRKSLTEFAKVLLCSVLSAGKSDQIGGLLSAAASLCNKLANEAFFTSALRKLLSGENIKRLSAFASTQDAKSSLFSIVSAISPAGIDGLIEECKGMVRNCSKLCDSVERQVQIRSAHKLALACNRFEDVYSPMVMLLQNAALACHNTFGLEIPEHIAISATRKKSRDSKTSKREERASRFEDNYVIAAGIAWQIKDLLSSEPGKTTILQSEVHDAFFALKAISEVSIRHCLCYDFMESSVVTAYGTLSLHITLENISINGYDVQSSRKKIRPDTTLDHLLFCSEQIFLGSGLTKPGLLPPECKSCAGMDVRKHIQKDVGSDGEALTSGKKISNFMKIFTSIFKLVTDTATLGLLSHNQQRCLTYASAYIKNIISFLKRYSHDEFEFQGDQFEEIHACLKCSFSYGAKLLNVSLANFSEDSPPPSEIHDLSNDLLNLISSIEIYCGSSYAARLVTVAKQWLPDLILGLASSSMLKQSVNHRTHVPTWLKVLAKIELNGLTDIASDSEGDAVKASEEFPAIKKLTEMMIPLLLTNPDVLDAIGVIFLNVSAVGLQRKDFGLFLGTLNFVLVKVMKKESPPWEKLHMMARAMQKLHVQIEKEAEELKDCGAGIGELMQARALVAAACENLEVS
ncbi:hypothetical protein V2J09_000225 [Rumex salicifolius]